ncbi:DUS1 [Lepeophtheirus salmonis]|uniref:tRNA-dihydrouridine(16/17) synthase [NAD(P)(+)] n=1 Tax=Lepeophtheirus salmonis TaxID=72036 RepID=A0A7R8HAW1_LEPSM|nr:DUS1 [Lepeophtheirus salmonis]CAF2972443.1 DUS1 [Lepeophtheirus salmonis]
MLTPRFNISQDKESLTISIYAPFTHLSSTTIHIEGEDFRFFSTPYYLRLHLSGNVIEDKGYYDADSNSFIVRAIKETPGEEFKGLDKITTLLTPSHPDRKRISLGNGIQEVDPPSVPEEEDPLCWFYPQEMPSEIEKNDGVALKTVGYGFGFEFTKVYSKLPFSNTLLDIVDVDLKSNEEITLERSCKEKEAFSDEHYLSDLFDPTDELKLCYSENPSNWLMNGKAFTKEEVNTAPNQHGYELSVLVVEDPYATWIQSRTPQNLNSLGHAIEKTLENWDKDSVDLELTELEEAAELCCRDEKNGKVNDLIENVKKLELNATLSDSDDNSDSDGDSETDTYSRSSSSYESGSTSSYESNPTYILAPMVDASELAWRLLARRYGTQLCYTPMWHSGVFVRDERYRRDALQTCPEDRPLIVQFCANDPETFRKAVELALKMLPNGFDAIDLNLGCPQIIAKRGHFGSFLQDEWVLISKLIHAVSDNFDIPITCKIRVFENDTPKTIQYAKMMADAGCKLLTVHGRHRDQKGALTGVANWEMVKAVVDALDIPVVSNGNVRYLDDVEDCIKQTGARGVMSAEGHLTNPALFSGLSLPVWTVAEEYFDLVDKYPCPLSYARGHVFKIFHAILKISENFDNPKENPWHGTDHKVFPWLCQPYVRPSPEVHLQKMKELNEKAKTSNKTDLKREFGSEGSENQLSKKKLKQLKRNPNKKFVREKSFERTICITCPNPKGTKCNYELCRKCCRDKCVNCILDCSGHKVYIKSTRERKCEEATITTS